MKRMHLHVSVPHLDQAVAFYRTLFDAEPTVLQADYAKWMLDDPRVNFAISARGGAAGVDHVGVQVDSAAELGALAGRLKAAGAQTFDQEATTCCYARTRAGCATRPASAGKPSSPSARPPPTARTWRSRPRPAVAALRR